MTDKRIEDQGDYPLKIISVPHLFAEKAHYSQLISGSDDIPEYRTQDSIQIVAIGQTGDGIWKACVLNSAGKLVFADSLAGFDSVDK
jgi:hypothetical protein